MREDNIEILEQTLKACEAGEYRIGAEAIRLRLTPEEMRKVNVLLPDRLEALRRNTEFKPGKVHEGKCRISCENSDSFSMARKRAKEGGEEGLMVLNFANAVHPGGGVRRGATAQEEDLCRKSTLLLSIESREAQKYYDYNRRLHTFLGSDGIITTPKVEVFRDERGNFLRESTVLAVMTCAAPNIRKGKEGLSDLEYEEMFYHRIMGMLLCAASFGYDRLVLGAFGCGAFYNDAGLVASLFEKAIKNLNWNGYNSDQMFSQIDFAVLDRGRAFSNYRVFAEYFGSKC